MKRSTKPPPRGDVTRRLAKALQNALQLLDGAADTDVVQVVEGAEQATLLRQCLALCEQHQEPSEPVRTIHHFACSGGTLISKCIAAMPNVQLLSEVDPLSTLSFDTDKPRFAPTDSVALLRQSTRGASTRLIEQLFQSQLRLTHSEASTLGQRLVLRDHAHGHFCVGPVIPERPTLRELIPPDLPVLSVMTVRHPLDSFASLLENKWLHFEPRTIDEYCERYQRFLDRHEGVPRFRYEDFVHSPQGVMADLCAHLALPFSPDFAELFDVFRLSGDSGRKGEMIGPRAQRVEVRDLLEIAGQSKRYQALCGRLGYLHP